LDWEVEFKRVVNGSDEKRRGEAHLAFCLITARTLWISPLMTGRSEWFIVKMKNGLFLNCRVV